MKILASGLFALILTAAPVKGHHDKVPHYHVSTYRGVETVLSTKQIRPHKKTTKKSRPCPTCKGIEIKPQR